MVTVFNSTKPLALLSFRASREIWHPSKKISPYELEGVREEVADIFIFLMYFCHEFNIDLFKAVEDKIKANGEKYPVDKAKGNSRKYDEL